MGELFFGGALAFQNGLGWTIKTVRNTNSLKRLLSGGRLMYFAIINFFFSLVVGGVLIFGIWY